MQFLYTLLGSQGGAALDGGDKEGKAAVGNHVPSHERAVY